MRILILNWRCPRNPRAGGAELLTLEVARRLVLKGHSVEWFSAGYPGAAPEEMIEGIRVVRAGRQWSVHWAAYRRYRGRLARTFDVVVDEVNTIPFFTPLWSDIPVVMFINQLAREVWWYESAFPVNAIGFLAEPAYLRLYRQTPVITISDSTRDDLLLLGYRSRITITPLGVDLIRPVSPTKSAEHSFLYVGRLSPSKRIEQMIEAFAKFRAATGAGLLWLAGNGSAGYVERLRRAAFRLNLGDSVVFWGRVTGPEKARLMASAHSLLMTSVREGWGLVVSEAGACGTPAIVYDVPGLRDSVRNESTGLVVSSRPDAMAQAMIRLVRDPELGRCLGLNARLNSDHLSFDDSAAAFGSVLQEAADA